jgi:sulfate adenylyltransferase subunit 2
MTQIDHVDAPTLHRLTHLERLEAESIHILREVAAEVERPVLLYSIGKESALMLHLAKQAFHPSHPPFPLLHVNTTWKFRDMYALRDEAVREAGMELIVYRNPEAMEKGINPSDHPRSAPRSCRGLPWPRQDDSGRRAHSPRLACR